MTLLARLEALKEKFKKREDADLIELVQVLIDGPEPEPVESYPAPVDAAEVAAAAEASRSLAAMEAATQAATPPDLPDHGGEA